MDIKRIQTCQRFMKELDTAISDLVGDQSSEELARAANEAVKDPLQTLLHCLESKQHAEAAAALMASALFREAMRRAESEEMARDEG